MMQRAALAALLVGVALAVAMAQDQASESRPEAARLAPTVHPPLPNQLAQYWLVPDHVVSGARPAAMSESAARLGRAAALVAAGDYAAALPLLSAGPPAGGGLGAYAEYYTGVALQGLGRFAEADTALTALVARQPAGLLKEAALMRLAEVTLALDDPGRAENLLETLSEQKLSAPADVFLLLGRAEEAHGHRDHALDAYRRVYYDFALAAQAEEARDALGRLDSAPRIPADRVARELARAEQLFSARRWAPARDAFAALARVAQGGNETLIALRLAECDYYLNRHRAARDALRPHLDGGAREAEARFFHLTATRALGDQATYVSLARRLVADHGDSEWAAETLNNLATHYVQRDDESAADAVFRELYRRFPQHRYSERAAWRIGWRAYRTTQFAETAAIFDEAAARFPRADYRPSWIYWSARSHDQIDARATANARYRLAVADYGNSYYGRLATTILEARREPLAAPTVGPSTAPPQAVPTLPTDGLIRELVAAELYDEALREVQYAQRVWGDSAQLQATSAWIRHQQGLRLTATERFTALRGAITTMRRAYPQFLATGGENLPPEVLRIIFPLDYWPLIRKYADAHKLDPFLIAALMAQESTFTPEIRSAANAYGLMQIIPDTGRLMARTLGIPRFTTAMLTQPETNVRMGTKYFKDMRERFGGDFYALAGYNAGPHRVVQWRAEAPGLPPDEFIDNIPFAETQNYVKRILGTAEDYRRLYGPGGMFDPNAPLTRRSRAATASR